MNTKKHFDIERFWLLLKLEFYKSKKGILLTFGSIFGLLLVGQIVSIIFNSGNSSTDHSNGYAFILFVGGFILSSLSFTDLSNGLRRYNYLTLPVSNLEKILSVWLLTSIGWIAAFSISYMMFIWLANGIVLMFFKQVAFESFDLFSATVFESIKTYLVLQSIFLVGAAHFKGYVIPKILLTLLVFGLICGVVGYFLLANLLPFESECFTDNFDYTQLSVYKIWELLIWCTNWVLAPLCWVITYYSIKEQEA